MMRVMLGSGFWEGFALPTTCMTDRAHVLAEGCRKSRTPFQNKSTIELTTIPIHVRAVPRQDPQVSLLDSPPTHGIKRPNFRIPLASNAQHKHSETQRERKRQREKKKYIYIYIYICIHVCIQ